MPNISSIMIYFHSDGRRHGATVLDRLRVLLAQELGEYRNLCCRVLAPYTGEAKDAWVELDVLAQTPSTIDEQVAVGGSQLTVAALRASLEFWWTQSCEFLFLDADKLRGATADELPKMLSLQELERQHADWLVRKRLSISGVCKGSYAGEYLAVSHRWAALTEPDATGEHLRQLVGFLRANPSVKYVFVSYMCLHQGLHRTAAERSEFTRMLPNISLVFLACRVLVLLDRAYVGRFWTMLECWLSLQKPSPDGLVAAPEAERRCTLLPLAEPAQWSQPELTPLAELGDALKTQWRGFDTDHAYHRLSQPDVIVANASDREVQLTKLLQLNELVRREITAPSVDERVSEPPASVRPRTALPAVSPSKRPDETAEVDELKKLFASGSPSQRGGSPSQRGGHTLSQRKQKVAGLDTLLEGLHLNEQLGAAEAWCREQGIDSVGELKEAEMEAELATAMQLKPAKQKLLLKRIAEV